MSQGVKGTFSLCSVPGCGKRMAGKGLCLRHYKMQRDHGRLELLPRHGATAGGQRSPTWKSWAAMLERCYVPTAAGFANYGGRGITVCAAWRTSFATFLSDMGERPVGKSIDRYPNVNGNYEPGNCRWATSKEQNSNRRNNILLSHKGETLTCCEWARRLGVNFSTLRRRHKKGWSDERILTTPFRCSGPRVAKHKIEGVSNACG